MATIPTTSNPMEAPGAVPTVSPKPLVWWLAGGTALVGAGALAAALIAGPQSDAQESSAATLSAKAVTPTSKPVPGKAAPQDLATARDCANCATVVSVQTDKRKGAGTGVGAVGGAVLGGVVGHQIGNGRGNDAMTVLGAVGGGLAGHEVEKNVRAATVYKVQLRMDDGSRRTVTQSAAPAVGSRVELDGNRLRSIAGKG